MVRQRGLMELNTVLWSGLPFKLVTRVLSFLSVPELCRYSVVCKKWNELIHTREFGVQCAQNARKGDLSIMLLRFQKVIPIDDPSPEPIGGWAILDFTTERWYRVEDNPRHDKYVLYPGVFAMGGGLVCQNRAMNNETWTNKEGNEVVVYNPISKTEKLLPIAPAHGASTSLPYLHLVVDDSTLSFKVFLINHSFDASEFFEDPEYSQEDRLIVLNDPWVHLYDSTTDDWKSLTNPSCIQRVISDEISTVFFQGFLYMFVGSRFNDAERRPVWRYSLANDTWENVDVEIPGGIDSPRLIVCANRLFFASWIQDKVVYCSISGIQRFCSFQVSEITVTDNKMTSLFRMANRDVKEFFDLAIEEDETYDLLMFGLGNSLLFISADSRKSMAFDLRKRKWVPGPPVSSDHISMSEIIWDGNPRVCESLWRGTSMNLILPNSTPW
ncbi:hypothetical protein M758_N010500 [Ceratodon purpureus]|nr:hypothetical protein M758_N010500 [Ceratodon purpureus]KAG0504907.1 hypothetical protein M758_N010500 [Ceratodon purpureus]